MEPNIKTDVRYGWVVVASAFTIGFITDGLSFTFGILMVDLLTQFQEDRAKTVLIISVMLGTRHLIGPLTGALCERHGHRVVVVTGSVIASTGFLISTFADGILYLTLTYGFLGGLGFGLVYPPGSICVLQHFEKRRSLATGLAACGSGVGSFCIGRLSRFLIDYYGWRGTILIEAGIVLNCAVCGLLLKHPGRLENTNLLKSDDALPQEFDKNNSTQEEYGINALQHYQRAIVNENATDSEQKDEENSFHVDVNPDGNNQQQIVGIDRLCKSLFSWNLLRDIRCWLLLLSAAMFELAFVTSLNFLPDQGTEEGMSKDETAWLISSIGISNTVSRVCIGWIGDLRCVNRMVLLEIILLLAGLSTGFSFLLRVFVLKISYTSFYGFLVGGYITLRQVVLTDVFGVGMISKTFGLLTLSVGVADIISTPFGGFLFDRTGSYDITFVVAGVEFLLSGLFLFALYMFMKRR